MLEVSDPGNLFSTNAATFPNLAPGSLSSFFDVFFDTTGAAGSYSAHYQFNLHDNHAFDALGGTSQQLDLFITATAVPEPSSIMLAALGLTGLGLVTWGRRRST